VSNGPASQTIDLKPAARLQNKALYRARKTGSISKTFLAESIRRDAFRLTPLADDLDFADD
jgi:hypothetical protein